jgi:hypothetical protein
MVLNRLLCLKAHFDLVFGNRRPSKGFLIPFIRRIGLVRLWIDRYRLPRFLVRTYGSFSRGLSGCGSRIKGQEYEQEHYTGNYLSMGMPHSLYHAILLHSDTSDGREKAACWRQTRRVLHVCHLAIAYSQPSKYCSQPAHRESHCVRYGGHIPEEKMRG